MRGKFSAFPSSRSLWTHTFTCRPISVYQIMRERETEEHWNGSFANIQLEHSMETILGSRWSVLRTSSDVRYAAGEWRPLRCSESRRSAGHHGRSMRQAFETGMIAGMICFSPVSGAHQLIALSQLIALIEFLNKFSILFIYELASLFTDWKRIVEKLIKNWWWKETAGISSNKSLWNVVGNAEMICLTAAELQFLSHLSVHEHSSSSRVFLMSSLQSEQMLIDDVFWHNGSKIFIDWFHPMVKLVQQIN